ncbi:MULTISPECIES: phosphoribosylglycinamide formyltransferase [Metallibacterium]|jgi:phosphoribosylglycinamide formyltransferase-1|uniref:phosphoribosylglycinamide formyltransferase n=1 Tax=Metallibacterium TaxID=1218803 RepID=UPI00260ED96E|nr:MULTISPECIES: phosphoribosylglycinamide formyltransferase [Metallibacterium]MBW8075377.1 phosphoribosylglycinamide formyltransferase [Metallibacterium scheffleri]
MPHARLAVLVSGRGSNLEALHAACGSGRLAAEIALVASNRPDALALTRARAAGIATLACDSRGTGDRAAWDMAFMAAVGAARPDWIVLAGFMRRLDGAAIAPWAGRMLNIHPSLLPRHPGLDTHRRALEAGDAEHGASVHFVTAELDGGPVLAQARVPVLPGDTPERLAARLLPLEHRLLVASLGALLSGRVRLRGDRVWVDGHAAARPLQLRADGNLS